MLHKGRREEGVDYFDDFDVPGDREGGGIFTGSLGQAEFESVRNFVDPENGLGNRMSCRNCGKAAIVWIGWEELYIIGTNGPGVAPLLPQGFQYSENNNDVYPTTSKCLKCGTPVCPHVTPDEAREHVNAATNAGYIPMGAIHQWQQAAQAHRAQMR